MTRNRKSLLATLPLTALIGCSSAHLAAEEVQISIDFRTETGTGSPGVFGGTQPRGLSDSQWDRLKQQGFKFVRSQADLTRLVPCDSPEQYRANTGDCQNPDRWDWEDGIYGNDFAGRAIARDMDVCLVIKNARWNRYPDAPDDEETVPRDMSVWAEVLRKIVNHYEGGLTYVELFNEVDRDPQLRVEGSPYSRREAYRAVARAAIQAIADSDHPQTLVGGPAAAGTGDDEAGWLLADDEIRPKLGFLSFHAFDRLHYPHDSVLRLRQVMREYDRDLPIVRSSYVPEEENDTHAPGTTDAVLVAEHLVGALGDGLAAAGLWEIQNRSGDDDYRYWFDGDRLAPAAALWPLLTQTLGLGRGENRSVLVETSQSIPCYAARNAAGRRVAVVVTHEPTKLRVSLPGDARRRPATAKLHQVNRAGEILSRREIQAERGDGDTIFAISTPAAAVVAIEFDSNR